MSQRGVSLFKPRGGYERVPNGNDDNNNGKAQSSSYNGSISTAGIIVMVVIVGLLALAALLLAILLPGAQGPAGPPGPITANLTLENLTVTNTVDFSNLFMYLAPAWFVPGGGAVPLPSTRVAGKGKRSGDIVYNIVPGNTAIILGNPSARVDARMPSALQSYVSKDYYIYSNTSFAHTLNITSLPNTVPCGSNYLDTTWDQDRRFTVARFDPTPGCYLFFKVVDCGTIMTIASRCVDFCTADLSHCEHPHISLNATWADIAAARIGSANVTTLNADTISTANLFVSNFTVENFVTVTTENVTNSNVGTLVANTVTSSSVMTDQVMNTEYQHTVSGAILPTHARQVLNISNHSNSMTLPSDLSAYAGKDVSLCTANSNTYNILLQGTVNKFDVNLTWSVLRLQSVTSRSCCATLSFTHNGSVSIKYRDQCTVFCVDQNMYHCVDPLRPAQTSLYHGRYLRSTKGSVLTSAFVDIDASIYPMKMTTYDGTVNYPLEPTFIEVLYAVSAGLYSSVLVETRDFPANQGRYFFTPQGNRFVVYFTNTVSGDKSGDFSSVFDKVTNTPPVVPAGTGIINGRAPDDPVGLLQNFVDYMLYSTFAGLKGNPEYIGYYAAKELLDTIVSTGKTHTAPIITTLTTQSFNPERLTEFRTADYHHVAPPARVTVSGFTGACAVLNSPSEGHLVAIGATNNVPRPSPLYEDYHPTNVSRRTVHHKVAVFLNSASVPVFPGTNTANCTESTPTISVTYGPITATTNYARTMGAMFYWFYEVIGTGTHVNQRLSFNSTASFGFNMEEWSQVISGALTNTLNTATVRSRDRTSTSTFSFNAARTVYRSRTLAGSRLNFRLLQTVIDYTGRFGIRPDLEEASLSNTNPNVMRATHWYDTVIENYLENVAYPAIATSGTSRSSILNLLAQVNYPGGKGDEFLTAMIPYLNAPPANYTPLYTSVQNLNTANPRSRDVFKTDVYAGRVKQSLTAGIGNVGYIHFTLGFRDPLNYAIYSNFAPFSNFNTSSHRHNREAMASIFAKVMQYVLVDLNCSHIILDNRGAGPTQSGIMTIREFFGQGGEQRVFDFNTLIRADPGVTDNNINLASFGMTDSAYTQFLNSNTVSPDLSEQNYPGSRFGNGGQFVFLTDTVASSGGDRFPNAFLGNATQQGHLGGNVTTTIIGSIDGRSSGYAGGNIPFPVSMTSPRIKTTTGAPYNDFFTTDISNPGFRIDGTPMYNRVSGLRPDYAQTTGLAGSNALWADWEELVYKDLGYTANDRPVLNGWTGPQTPFSLVVINPLYTTAGSSTVVVAMPSPHGFFTGDNIALGSTAIPVAPTGGLTSTVLTGGHIITVINATHFSLVTQAQTSLGLPLPSPNATSIVNGGGGTFRVMKRTHWRDAWLEQSIRTVIVQAGGALRKRGGPAAEEDERTVIRRRIIENDHADQRARASRRFDLEEANRIHGNNVGCLDGVRLTHPTEMPVNYEIQIPVINDDETEAENHLQKAHAEMGAVISAELKNGGMCLNAEGALMATPSCKVNPRIVFASSPPPEDASFIESADPSMFKRLSLRAPWNPKWRPTTAALP